MGPARNLSLRSLLLRVKQSDDPTTGRYDCRSSRVGVSHLQGVRVLIVDDESDSRELLVRVLTAHGCQIQEADGGATALELQDQGVFDIIVSDVGMPQMDGYEFIQEWRSIEHQRGRSRIPAIALTAYARSEDRRLRMLAGFQSHVTKPVEIGELHRRH